MTWQAPAAAALTRTQKTPTLGAPLLAQHRVTTAQAVTEVLLGIMRVLLGTVRLVLGRLTAPLATLHPQGTTAAALGFGEVVLGVVMV